MWTQQPQQQRASPLADAGQGDLFWDIVKGRVSMTPPPIGELGNSEHQVDAVAPAPGTRTRRVVQQSAQKRVEELNESGNEAAQYPPQCPVEFAKRAAADECVGSGEECELCLNGPGFCKPSGTRAHYMSARVSRVPVSR